MIVAHLTRSARIQRRQVYRLLGKGRLKRLIIKDSGLHRPPGCETFLQRYSQRRVYGPSLVRERRVINASMVTFRAKWSK